MHPHREILASARPMLADISARTDPSSSFLLPQSAVHATFVELALCFNNRLHFVQQRPRVGPGLYFAVLYCHIAVPHRYGQLLWPPCVADVDIIFLPWFRFSSIFFSSPTLSGCRLDVYHTSTHGVALEFRMQV